jgi:uncharacterized membrane protein
VASETAVDLTLGQLASESSDLLRETAGPVVLAFAVLTGSYVAFDMIVPADAQLGLQSALSIVGIVVAYALTRALLTAAGANAAQRVGGYIGLGILTGIGIALGLLLLIVPGLILAARWTIAAPILLAEDATIGDAMSRSWAATAAHWGKLLVAQLLVAAPLFAGMAVTILTTSEENVAPTIIASIASNALLGVYSIGTVVLSVAAYRLLRPSSDGLADVFA